MDEQLKLDRWLSPAAPKEFFSGPEDDIMEPFDDDPLRAKNDL